MFHYNINVYFKNYFKAGVWASKDNRTPCRNKGTVLTLMFILAIGTFQKSKKNPHTGIGLEQRLLMEILPGS